MLVRHTLTATATCPNNGLPDRYRVAVYTSRVLLCEGVVVEVDELLAEPTYQEAFTQALADRLGCKVKTRCPHLRGGRVVTVCVCRPQKSRTVDPG